MANPTISQIKIGTTTYDICDYFVRNNIQLINCYKINRTAPQQTLVKLSYARVEWDALSTLADKFYIGYLAFNLDNYLVYACTLAQSYMLIYHWASGTTSTPTPTAVQLWFNFVDSF